MRRAALALIALIGCTEPEGGALQSKVEPRSPGAPIVRLFESCGLLEDERVWCFYPRGFSKELTGARTVSGNGPFALFAGAEVYARCFARSDHVLRCFGSSLEGGLAGAPAPDTCEFTPWLSFEKVKYACAKQPGVAAAAPPISEISSSCALTTDGNVWCWGREDREDGEGPLFLPTRIAGIDGRARAVAAESDARRVCAILDDGSVACAVGRRPGDTARLVPELEKIVALGLGLGAGCFLDGAGVLRCYRDDYSSGRDPLPAVERIETALRFSQISMSLWIACGVTFDRGVACFRVLGGDDPELPSKLPLLVPGVEGAVEVSVAGNAVFVRRHDGSVLEGVWPDSEFVLVAP